LVLKNIYPGGGTGQALALFAGTSSTTAVLLILLLDVGRIEYASGILVDGGVLNEGN
jgi:hypothetical protein